MPLDNEESQGIWQTPGSQQGDQTRPYMPFPDAEDEASTEQSLRSGEGLQEEPDTDAWVSVDEEDETSSSRTEGWRRLARQASPALVPLLFAAITFLFVLPIILSAKGHLPATGLLPLALLLIMLAVVQGALMYFTRENDGLWSLCIIGGFEVFLLVGCFAVFGPLVSLFLLIALVILDLILAQRCIKSTPEGTVDIVYSFGKYTRTLPPGLNIISPWEKVVNRLSVLEIPWTTPPQRVQIARDQDVQFLAGIGYQLLPEDAHLIVEHTENWEESLHERFLATIQGVMNTLTPEDFIAWQQGGRGAAREHATPEAPRWDHVNALLKQRVQEDVAEWGVQINWVGIRDVSLIPRLSVPGGTAVAAKGAASTANKPFAAEANAAGPMPARSAPPPSTVAAKPPMQQPAPPPNTKEATITDDMTQMYEAVRLGRITDPATIRNIARRFEAIASDPESSKAFGYDAARAAKNLYQRALYFEQTNEPVSYDDTTQPDWPIPRQRPLNNNLMTGG